MNSNNICFIAFFLLVFGLLIVMNNIYSKNGDIHSLTHDFTFSKLEEEHKNKDKILSRLHNLIIYKYNYVYWIYYFFIALVITLLLSLTISAIYKIQISFSGSIAIFLLIFVALELPKRFVNSHFEKAAEIEGVQLLNILRNKYLGNKNEKEIS